MKYLSHPHRILSIGLLCIALGVAAGAFGAHGLKQVLTPDLLAVWETAVRYQLLHGMALVLLAISMPLWAKNPVWLPRLALGFGLGICLFSGSLYALAITNIRILGAITPIGGAMWLATWLTWAALAWNQRP